MWYRGFEDYNGHATFGNTSMATPTGKRKEPEEDSPPKKTGKKLKQVRCVTCHKDVGEDAILCQWCSKWEHRVCADLSTSEYDVLSNSSNKIMFFCSVCCPKVPLALKMEDRNPNLSFHFENIRKAIADLSTKIDNLNSSEKELQKNIRETTSALSTMRQPLNEMSASSSSVAVNIVKEMEDKERRKYNLIFYNVPEPLNSTSSWKADSKYIVDLCKATFDVDIQVAKSFRLGKKGDT